MQNITVIIPAHNEGLFIDKVLNIVKKNTLVNDIIVVDNLSTDDTAAVSKKCGARVVCCTDQGKGYAMETGLSEAKNEVIVFLDGDIINYSENIISNLATPILNDEADFIKSTFDRASGRVTALVALPLIQILYPDIYPFSQPLSGIICGKKSFFNKLTFEKDYGVDIGILLDMIKINARVLEVSIGKLENNSQGWRALEKMAKEVAGAILRRKGF